MKIISYQNFIIFSSNDLYYDCDHEWMILWRLFLRYFQFALTNHKQQTNFKKQLFRTTQGRCLFAGGSLAHSSRPDTLVSSALSSLAPVETPRALWAARWVCVGAQPSGLGASWSQWGGKTCDCGHPGSSGPGYRTFSIDRGPSGAWSGF